MPNWCDNRLTVITSTPEFDKFAQEGITFERINPTPKELSDVPSPNNDEALKADFLNKYGATDWYNWRVKNWGTKWDVEHPIAVENGESAFFNTAWAPPIEAFVELTRKFPGVKLELYYYEPGCHFAGVASMSDGNVHNEYVEDSERVEEIAVEVFNVDFEEEID